MALSSPLRHIIITILPLCSPALITLAALRHHNISPVRHHHQDEKQPKINNKGDIIPPSGIRDSMVMQAEAERRKRAEIIEAEGNKEILTIFLIIHCVDRLIRLFESWMERHGKKYHSLEEKLHRFEVFRDNLEHIDETNKKVKNYRLGLNQFADMTYDEFKQKYSGLKADLPKSGKSCCEFTYKDVNDRRNKGVVTPIKNQGSCGRQLQQWNGSIRLSQET